MKKSSNIKLIFSMKDEKMITVNLIFDILILSATATVSASDINKNI